MMINRSTFDKIVRQYIELADLLAYVLRLELRCQMLHGVHKVFESKFYLDYPAMNPDESAKQLYFDVLELDDEMTLYLPTAQHEYRCRMKTQVTFAKAL